MSGAEQYRSDSQQTLLTVLDLLGERRLESLPLTDLVDRIGAKRDQVFRALQNAQIAGWAEQTPGGGWRLAPGAPGHAAQRANPGGHCRSAPHIPGGSP